MRIITLSNNQQVQIDDVDFAFINQWKWKIAGSGYAARNTRHGTLYMHRVLSGVCGLVDQSKVEVDHKNGNKLDNRKDNLRVVTHKQNMRGFRTQRNQSGVRGVNWFERTRKWVVRIKVGEKNLNLGYYTNLGEAINARQRAELKYWGELSS